MDPSTYSGNETHTRRYLHALLVPLQQQRGTSSEADSVSSSASSSRRASNDEGADTDGDGKSPPSLSATATAIGKEAPDSSGKGTGSELQSDKASQGSATADNTIDVDARINKVLELLSDNSTPEEDRPDKLKELLLEVTGGTEATTLDLDATALAILHRHREDVAPTGQSFSSPTPGPKAGTMSRSSSFRRNLTPTSASSLALKRAGIVAPTRPLSPSPLRAQAPSLAGSHRNPDPFSHVLDSGASATSGSSAPSSPFGSPRMLNATAPLFKPNVGATEFRPSTPTLSSPGIPSLMVKMPEHAFRSRSPIGTPSIESPTLWSFQNSPLGTPKFASGTMAVSPSFAGSNNGSYFPTSSSIPAFGSAVQPPAIPSDPWNRLSDSSGNSSISNPGVTHSSSTASSESSYEETPFDPFASSPLIPREQQSSGKEQILLSEEEDEWGIPSTSYEETAGRSPNMGDRGPRWNLYDDEDEEEDDLQILQFKGGQLLQDELVIVEPPQQERPVFASAPVPQSTDQYSQLPQNYPSPTPQPALPPGLTPQFQPGGLDSASSNYIMTPFDVLCSIFAGSDILPADLEEALSRNGYDIDRSMEWIINNPRLPGVPRAAEDQVDHLNMLSLDLNHLPGSGAASPARALTPGLGGSGSRPIILSIDSFSRHLAPHGRPQSPRWTGAHSNDGSRPGTPRGGERGNAEGYFGAGPGGGASPSTRLCKYYLQGNCLRSDCRFSHDLSKAVCKFWLRGHCLKGEGRCEFLHSVPPHLAEDVAQLRNDALRVREQEKSRWMHRGYEGEDRAGFESARRVEEDFPTLAAATASTSARASSGTANKDPERSRYAGVVKSGRPVAQVPVNSRPSLPRSASDTSGALTRAGERAAPFSQPRQSARLALRPPTLLPTITTGAAVSHLYEEYRENFFELGNSRNKCLVKAANCWQKGDGAGARRWSREAQDWNRQIAREGAIAAGQIINERKRALREAVMHGQRPGRADEAVDRQYKGQECGAGMGICLGVAAAGEALGPEGPRLAVAERTEVALDLHGLHADEAIEYLEKFLLAIASEHVMRGLCYVIVGQERHTGTADAARGTRKVRLADAVGSWLDSFGYAFWLTNGIYAIDPYL